MTPGMQVRLWYRSASKGTQRRTFVLAVGAAALLVASVLIAPNGGNNLAGGLGTSVSATGSAGGSQATASGDQSSPAADQSGAAGGLGAGSGAGASGGGALSSATSAANRGV